MYFNKCKLVASLAICLIAYSPCLAQQPTHSKEEKNRFRQFASGYRPEDHRAVLGGHSGTGATACRLSQYLFERRHLHHPADLLPTGHR